MSARRAGRLGSACARSGNDRKGTNAMTIGTETEKDAASSAIDGSSSIAPRHPRRRTLSPFSRALWALTAIAAALLAIGSVASRTLAVSGALLLAGCTVALLLEGVARGWEIGAESPEARRRVGVRTVIRVAAALVVVSVACASAIVGWSGLAIASAAILCIFALVGGASWLASVADAEDDARVRPTPSRK
jgi:hypothetical protein